LQDVPAVFVKFFRLFVFFRLVFFFLLVVVVVLVLVMISEMAAVLCDVFGVVFAFGAGFCRRIGMVQRDRMWTAVEDNVSN
jgi:hypothetical protein